MMVAHARLRFLPAPHMLGSVEEAVLPVLVWCHGTGAGQCTKAAERSYNRGLTYGRELHGTSHRKPPHYGHAS
jgi:hypothetical protein